VLEAAPNALEAAPNVLEAAPNALEAASHRGHGWFRKGTFDGSYTYYFWPWKTMPKRYGGSMIACFP
jgi:hypothetical protein